MDIIENVYDFYRYRDELKDKIKKEKDILSDLKVELRNVESYMRKIEKEEINEYKTLRFIKNKNNKKK